MNIMSLFTLILCFLPSCLWSLSEDNSAQTVFTDGDIAMKRLFFPGHSALVQISLESHSSDRVTAVSGTRLYSCNFQKSPVESKVLWDCADSAPHRVCSYNITAVHKMDEADRAFVCRTNGRETHCCEMNVSSESPSCTTSSKIENIDYSIRTVIMKEGEPSALVESGDSADFYVARSGRQQYVGIHKFGKKCVGPSYHDKEQHFVGLMPSRHIDDPLQDKVYAFYKEKNRDTDPYSKMWLPFVTQVCMSDIGGPKALLQRSWTSQMNAKLFCGDMEARQHFSELIDVSIVHAEQWQDTMVYGLFRNEWGMSAVCAYTIQDIDYIFKTSPFKGSSAASTVDRPRTCVPDSTKLMYETLRSIQTTLEMELCVQPVNKSGALFKNHHMYTHIHADSSQSHQHAVLFLSLNTGAVHKVIQTESQSFAIAEYKTFNHRAHIRGVILHPTTRKLYAYTGSELVQVDVENCGEYGDSCEECALAKDPYCRWNETNCAPKTHNSPEALAAEYFSVCAVRLQTEGGADHTVETITLTPGSRFFLKCPVKSPLLKYRWTHLDETTVCRKNDQDCFLLIDNMSPEKAGVYTCESETSGFVKVQARYLLQMENGAGGLSSGPLLWVCLLTLLLLRSSAH